VKMTQEVNRLLIVFLVAFLIMLVAAAYWAIGGAEELLRREDNPRLVEVEAEIARGQLVDRSGVVLAESLPLPNGQMQRRYPYPETAPFTGYFSLRYGTGGAETAYNTLLRGDSDKTLDVYIQQQLLHRPAQGSDIQLTLSLPLQQRLDQALLSYRGAGVLLAVPSGDILALVSHPNFDPNTLDAQWDTLRTADGNPFFNRVLQGRYQPGGVLETPLVAAALLSNRSLTDTLSDANQPVMLDDQTNVTCAFAPPGKLAMTLLDSYLYGCPRPFVMLAESLGQPTVDSISGSFWVNQPVTLEGFVPKDPIIATATPVSQPSAVPSSTLAQVALGQSPQQAISPLNMALIAAAVSNDGNAPVPHTIQAVRPHGGDWQSVPAEEMTRPFVAAATAHRLSELMASNMLSGVLVTPQPKIPLSGHAGTASSGKGKTLSWFIGFVTLADSTHIAVAIVLEDVNDPGAAARIGQEILIAAYEQPLAGTVTPAP